MLVVAFVEPGGIHIEGIAVLHDELAHSQQTRPRPGLVAELGLNLIPDLRQLLIAAQFLARDVGHHLFMGHAQSQPCALAVLEAEHILAHAGPTPALFPEFARMERRQQEFLTDRVHLLPDDGDDLVQRSLAEEKIAVNTGAQRPYVTGPQQKLMAGGLCIRRCFPQSRNKKLRPTMHSFSRGATFYTHSKCLGGPVTPMTAPEQRGRRGRQYPA